MPVLKNPKHERFVQEIVKGKSQREAYRLAGYDAKADSVADAAASRLLGDVKARARLEELQGRVAEKAVVTAHSILQELDEARLMAKHLEQPSAMVAAIMGRAKVAGVVIDRKEVGKPGDFDNMTTDELRDFISGRTGRTSEGEADPPAKRGSGKPRGALN